mgnify:CR=1 FL=1
MPDTLSLCPTTTPGAVDATPGGLSGSDIDILDNGGRCSLALLAAIDAPDDDDRATLTMEDHLSLHPEDSFCEECGGAGYIGEWIHTCYACNGTGRTGAATNDDNTDDGEEVGL